MNATESGYYCLNSNHSVNSAQVIIHNIDQLSPVGDRYQFHLGMCQLILAQCTPEDDPEGYYNNVDECVAFMGSSAVRQVAYSSAAGNTDVCRRYHTTLIPYGKVHCKHAGRTGGGMCVDPAYYDTYYGPDQDFRC